jgi:hypothetical protein
VWRNEFHADKKAAAGYSFAMSKAEILAEIPKLTKEERHEIRVKLAEMDSDGWLDEDDPLSDADKALFLSVSGLVSGFRNSLAPQKGYFI